MTREDALYGQNLWRDLRAAGSGGAVHAQRCDLFDGWAQRHGAELVDLAAAAVGIPPLEPLVQNMVIDSGPGPRVEEVHQLIAGAA